MEKMLEKKFERVCDRTSMQISDAIEKKKKIPVEIHKVLLDSVSKFSVCVHNGTCFCALASLCRCTFYGDMFSLKQTSLWKIDNFPVFHWLKWYKCCLAFSHLMLSFSLTFLCSQNSFYSSVFAFRFGVSVEYPPSPPSPRCLCSISCAVLGSLRILVEFSKHSYWNRFPNASSFTHSFDSAHTHRKFSSCNQNIHAFYFILFYFVC